jgi:membrane protein
MKAAKNTNKSRRKVRKTARDIFQLIKHAQVMSVSSSLSYATILSIIPLLALTFAIFHVFGGSQKMYEQIEPWILSNLAQEAGTDTIMKLREFINNTHAGVVGVSGFVGLLITSFLMLDSVELAVNRIWQAPNRRKLVKRAFFYLMFLIVGPIGLAFVIGVSASFHIPLQEYFPTGTGFFFILTAIFTAIYKWVPNCEVRWKYAFITGCITSSLWTLARWGYSFYIAKIVNYHGVYGSLGAVPILLLWTYIAWVIILTGAAITAILQDSKVCD